MKEWRRSRPPLWFLPEVSLIFGGRRQNNQIFGKFKSNWYYVWWNILRTFLRMFLRMSRRYSLIKASIDLISTQIFEFVDLYKIWKIFRKKFSDRHQILILYRFCLEKSVATKTDIPTRSGRKIYLKNLTVFFHHENLDFGNLTHG